MRNRIYIMIVILIIFILAIDLFTWYNLRKTVRINTSYYTLIYWCVTSILLLFLLYLTFFRSLDTRSVSNFKAYYLFIGLFILFYLPKIIFTALRLVDLLFIHAFKIFHKGFPQLFSYTGIFLAILLFLFVLYGLTYGKFHFKVREITLRFDNLPEEFHNYRIVQFSDLHLGSWYDHEEKLRKAVNLINNQKADLVFFTGDLVNNFHEEASPYLDILKQIKAKDGKYSILGNHDYGDYYNWESEEARAKNLDSVKNNHELMGFNLLCNESDTVVKDSSGIGILGVENWGKPPFHQYGDISQAQKNLPDNVSFRILLSHDPSHWRVKVLKKEDIELTLSGHTHGMQFGIWLPFFKWSPVQWRYPEWGGLYESNGQKLYVNTGLGHIGFPGRSGIRPEITSIKLKKAGL